MINPKTPTPYAAKYLKVYKAKIIGKYIFRVTYRRPYAPALSSWALSILPEKPLRGQDLMTTKLRSHPIGTGPYEFFKWIHGYEIVLKANPRYFMGVPHIKRLIYKIVPDSSTMFLMLKLNEIDYMGLTPVQFKYESDGEKFESHYKKYSYPASSYTFLGYNLLYPLFKSVKVRQALSYAINKKEIIKGALLGLGIHSYGPFMPGTYFYNKNVKIYGYNPQKALAILNKRGWRLNKKGILEKNGILFKFTILTSQGNSGRLAAAEIIKQNLKKIGIEANIRVMESTVLVSKIMKKRFQSVLSWFIVTSDPYNTASLFMGSDIVPKGLNITSFNDPEIDELFRKARSTFDLKKQRKYYFKIQKLLAEEVPYTFLYTPYSMSAVNSDIRGIKPAPAGIDYDVRKWYYARAFPYRTHAVRTAHSAK
jgi:peptide/nickel transport system substrate-binding protein